MKRGNIVRVKADIDKIKMVGDNITESSVLFANKTRELENAIDEIINSWQGDDATRYINLLKENYVRNLAELASVLNDYGTYISSVSQIYASLEQGAMMNYNGGHYE